MTLEQEKKHKELMRRSKQNIMDAQRVVRQARELVRSSRRKSRPSPLLSGDLQSYQMFSALESAIPCAI